MDRTTTRHGSGKSSRSGTRRKGESTFSERRRRTVRLSSRPARRRLTFVSTNITRSESRFRRFWCDTHEVSPRPDSPPPDVGYSDPTGPGTAPYQLYCHIHARTDQIDDRCKAAHWCAERRTGNCPGRSWRGEFLEPHISEAYRENAPNAESENDYCILCRGQLPTQVQFAVGFSSGRVGRARAGVSGERFGRTFAGTAENCQRGPMPSDLSRLRRRWSGTFSRLGIARLE